MTQMLLDSLDIQWNAVQWTVDGNGKKFIWSLLILLPLPPLLLLLLF